MTEKQWPDFSDLDRKAAAFEKLMDFARGEDASVRKSTENSIVAENETAWEIGVFADQRPESDAYRDGLIVRTRRDAMAAKLNSTDTLDTVSRLEESLQRVDKQLSEIRTMVRIAVIIAVSLLITSIFKGLFG